MKYEPGNHKPTSNMAVWSDTTIIIIIIIIHTHIHKLNNTDLEILLAWWTCTTLTSRRHPDIAQKNDLDLDFAAEL